MISFGDRVQIKSTPETVDANIAGLEGDVYGFTTPSVTGVEVIGGAPDDHAVNVCLKTDGRTLWLRPDLVEFVHCNPGTEMVVGNIKSVRQSDGSWVESNIDDQPSTGSVNTNSSSIWGWLKRLFTK